MKTKTTIQMEFQQVSAQAKSLEDCADELRDVRRKIDTLISELQMGWSGESADLYFEKCEQLSEKINTSGKNLDKVAGVIRRTAKAYRDAELEAIQIIQS